MSTATPKESRPRTPGVAFVLITLFLDILGIGLMIPTLPKLVTTLCAGDISRGAASFGLVMTTYTLMLFLFAPVQGALSDQHGRRPVLFLSLSGTAICYAVLSYAHDLPHIYLAQIANGITGASVTVCQAYLADVTPPEARARSFGLIGAMFGLGLILGPALAGVLGAHDLQLPFKAALALTLLNLAYGAWVLPESLPADHRRPFSWDRAHAMGALRLLLSSGRLRSLAVVMAVTQVALQSLRTTWMLYTEYRYGWTLEQSAYSLAIVGLCGALVQGGLIRVLLRRMGEFPTLVASLIAASLSYVIFGLAAVPFWLYVGMPLTAAGNACWPVLQGMASNQLGPKEQGSLQGATTSLSTLSTAAGTWLASALFSHFTSPRVAAPLPGAPYFAGALLFAVAAALCVAWLGAPSSPLPDGVAAGEGSAG